MVFLYTGWVGGKTIRLGAQSTREEGLQVWVHCVLRLKSRALLWSGWCSCHPSAFPSSTDCLCDLWLRHFRPPVLAFFAKVEKCPFPWISLKKRKGVRWLSLTKCPGSWIPSYSKIDHMTECNCGGLGDSFVEIAICGWRDRVRHPCSGGNDHWAGSQTTGLWASWQVAFVSEPLMISLSWARLRPVAQERTLGNHRGQAGVTECTGGSMEGMTKTQGELSLLWEPQIDPPPPLLPLHTHGLPSWTSLALVQTGFLFCQNNSRCLMEGEHPWEYHKFIFAFGWSLSAFCDIMAWLRPSSPWSAVLHAVWWDTHNGPSPLKCGLDQPGQEKHLRQLTLFIGSVGNPLARAL